ncbi:MAG: cytochrome c biogenesis protein ResB, partial [Planctomycetes bacterium]|nr:cytochrome c biogenesis protein ResB [Planctomycetota bacterium]
LVVAEPRGDGSVREHLISAHELLRQPTIHGKDWPFSIVVRRYYGNCEPALSRQQHAPDTVDGLHLRPIPSRQKMSDFPGALLEVVVPGQPAQLGIVWGLQRYPWTVTVNGGKWAIDLRQQVFDFVTPDGVPFEVRMEKFRKEFHPGVRMARHFSSDVTKVEAGGEQRFHIAMNEPMRYAGFMLSQNDWGPQDGSNGPFYSVLEVSTNPADRWQLWACVLIGAGLLLHFGSKLVKHVNHQSKVST